MFKQTRWTGPQMRIGIPTEIKTQEYRVALTPAGCRELTANGHEVFVQRGAGVGSGFSDEQYLEQGAFIVRSASDVFENAKVIVKVKEPQASEVAMLTNEHVLFTYLHLASDSGLTRDLMASGATCIAYETIFENGRLPLLAPMSEIAGKLAVQSGAKLLERPQGGSGVLLSGAVGVAPGHVVVIGGGIAGEHAARVAAGMGAFVTVLDRDINRLRALDAILPANTQTLYSTALAIEQSVANADMVIGAVLVPGAKAPHLLTREHLKLMKPGSVVLDIAIDQGGCFETSRPTTHEEPTYVEEGITHYCVANIPGATPVTSTLALTNATLPYLMRLLRCVVPGNEAVGSLDFSIFSDETMIGGINIVSGALTNQAVAQATGVDYTSFSEAV